MYSSCQSRADLHVHSKYSDRPSEWFLRRIGAPECFVEATAVYREMRDRGMDFVTITDHNCIHGALEISHLPGTFISSEVTTYFPENGCKIHCLVLGISEAQFAVIQEIRENIYDLHKYLIEEDVIHSIAHPLYRVNSRLTIDQLEKLLLMFKRFELVNGTRDGYASDLFRIICENLTLKMVERMANRHNIDPCGPLPWKKWFTGGSDDHSGAHPAAAHTITPYAQNVEEFLAYLRRGDHQPGGASGGSLVLAHCLYHIAYGYYKSRFLNGAAAGKPSIVGGIFQRLLEEAERKETKPTYPTVTQRVVGYATNWIKTRRMRRLNDVERTLVEEFSKLFSDEAQQETVSAPGCERKVFRTACRISHALSYSFLRRFEQHLRQGQLIDSLQTIAALGPVALSFAPFLAAFGAQHKDSPFLREVAGHFPASQPLLRQTDRKAWVTDTYSDVNGVCRTIQTFGRVAKQTGRQLTVLTCLNQEPKSSLDLKNFKPVGTFPLPEYEMLEISLPPFLEVIEYLERNRFNEIIISTPGPMGLTALAAARLLGIRTTGIYHTDFPQIVRDCTADQTMGDLTWRFMLWFYDQMDAVLAPSRFYLRQLCDGGIDSEKISLLGRGVDLELFHPRKVIPDYWQKHGLNGDFKFIYVGRVSPDKNLELLVESFEKLLASGRKADLAIVGDGPLLDKLKARHRNPRIAFTGFLDGDELAVAYATSDVMVFPSVTDTFGNAVLEAQASGLPAIVSNQGGPAEIVTPFNSGIVVDLEKPDSLTQAMVRLFDDVNLHCQLTARALENASQRSWDNVFEEFWNGHRQPAAQQPPQTATGLRVHESDQAQAIA
jgi:glycosyltransferase involved in cell wall biosynthesis